MALALATTLLPLAVLLLIAITVLFAPIVPFIAVAGLAVLVLAASRPAGVVSPPLGVTTLELFPLGSRTASEIGVDQKVFGRINGK